MALVIIGSIMFFYNGGFVGLNEVKFWLKETKMVDGYIIGYEETSTIHDGEYVYKFDYSFPVEQNTYYGYSYSSLLESGLDDRVTIEYITSDPDISKIEGTSYNQSYWLYIGLLFLIAAFILLLIWYIKVRVTLYIVNDGTVTTATYDSVEATNITVNDEPRFRVKYSYQAGNKKFIASRLTADPEDEAESLKIMYANRKPSKYRFLDSLPGALAARLSAESATR